MKNNVYHNSEGYLDQTAGAAISSCTKKERSDRRKAKRKANARARKQAALETAGKAAEDTGEARTGGECP